MKDKNTVKEYSKISPTAKLAAYWKAQSDIPYAAEIADLVGAEQTARQLADNLDSPMTLISVPVMEARYKSINYAIKESKLINVLEMASGLSPRGFEITDRGGIYVGTDLPNISAETFPIIREIAAKNEIPAKQLHLQPVNILDKKQLEDAADYFAGQPFVICNEGLLMYFNHEEKATAAQNIYDLLSQTGGAWITPDLTFHETAFEMLNVAGSTDIGEALKKNIKARLEKVTATTGRSFKDNRFSGSAEAIQFYKEFGFSIQGLPMYDENYTLSTLSVIAPKARELVLKFLSEMKVWILRASR